MRMASSDVRTRTPPHDLLTQATLIKYGKIPKHEEALANGDIKFLHTYDEAYAFLRMTKDVASIFVSHQW